MNELTLNNIKTTKVSLIMPENMDISEYADLGLQLSRANHAIHWMLGDYLRYGEPLYGDQYVQVVSDLGFQPETLRNDIYVASRWPIEQRNPDVSYSHHQILSSLPSYIRIKAIGEAHTDDLSTRDCKAIKNRFKSAIDGLDKEDYVTIMETAERQDYGTEATIALFNEFKGQIGMESDTEEVTVAACPACGYEL